MAKAKNKITEKKKEIQRDNSKFKKGNFCLGKRASADEGEPFFYPYLS